ncbi:uncharacterized protein APUU_60134A [Aspergillus puulaauensis]|uniref:Xylose isomerase-like TIM barrel domain-containing protein n=1 Tax=Aspergillus puulaauensis TaxID=1220207 RepID=A0A7R8AQ66_9EURO|nr:uncharacterized protein APUU_60134A [Aspergillus puulaauensis]BCS27086.1 hypothetical protein APUU_60134A [Aspergillus puulaauensis]
MPQDAGLAPRGLPPDEHLNFYRGQLRLARVLRPTVITAQSGSDYWTLEEAVYFYRMSLQIDKEEGFQGKVGHETHRKRGLFNPRIASLVLKHVPELKVTVDVSHWVVVCERLLNQEEDQNSLGILIAHVHHIHARIGTTQASQCPEPLNTAFAAEREFFEGFWIDIVKAKQREDPRCRITWVPEYGPFPYHPIGSVQTHGEVADSEGMRLEALFNSVASL